MLKTLITLFRGQAAQAAEALADGNALLLIDQHIRDAGAGLDRARRALAIAMAQDATEVKRIEDFKRKIADLEARAMAALEGAREDLAMEAAEAIAGLEADKASAEAAHTSFERESRKLRNLVSDRRRQCRRRRQRAARC
jgi:phage shock protein A